MFEKKKFGIDSHAIDSPRSLKNHEKDEDTVILNITVSSSFS
jgi:hypothetical protein